MYTLRIIEKTRENENDAFDEVIENFELGNSYTVLIKGATKEFDKIMKNNHSGTKHDGIKSLLCAENGEEFFIWNETSNRMYSYYIMTESGKTFDRL